MNADPLTRAIAVWGAITGTWGAIAGTLAVGWPMYRHYRDRGRLRVDCNIGFVEAEPGRLGGLAIVWRVTNIGKEPVQVVTVGGTLRHPSEGLPYFIVRARQLPRMLAPSDYVVEYSDTAAMWRLATDLKTPVAHDSLERRASTHRARRSRPSVKARGSTPLMGDVTMARSWPDRTSF
jgi:hypothetical protein